MRQLLLRGGYAARIFAFEDVGQLCRQLKSPLLGDLAVPDDIDGNARVDITEDIGIHIEIRVDFDDILFARFAACDILDERHRAVERLQPQEAVYLHAASSGYVVDNYAVFYRINIHHFTSRSFRIRAIRIYLP